MSRLRMRDFPGHALLHPTVRQMGAAKIVREEVAEIVQFGDHRLFGRTGERDEATMRALGDLRAKFSVTRFVEAFTKLQWDAEFILQFLNEGVRNRELPWERRYQAYREMKAWVDLLLESDKTVEAMVTSDYAKRDATVRTPDNEEERHRKMVAKKLGNDFVEAAEDVDDE